MKYYLDTEFHEYNKQPKVAGLKVGKSIPTVDLISIGIVSEPYTSKSEYSDKLKSSTSTLHSGKEYYAICKEFNIKDAWYSWQPKKHSLPMGTVKEYWLRENVLKSIHWEFKTNEKFTLKGFTKLINKYGKTRKQIAEEIEDFIYQCEYTEHKFVSPEDFKPEFYAYYASYDWVVFCQLFGKMMTLPKGFTRYCKDLKQMLDEKEVYLNRVANRDKSRAGQLRNPKTHPDYPKQENEHNALDDAKWNKKLHAFLNTI